MGNSHSRPEDRFRYITREVNSLRWSLRTSRQNISKAKKESIVGNLAQYSSEIISMNGRIKRKNIEETLKIISETMEEVLKIEPSSELDAGAVESNSFVNVPINQKRSNSLGSLISSKKANKQEPAIRASLPTLRDIETKVQELKTQVSTAVDNKDSAQLRLYQKTIKVLATDLECIDTEKDTPLEKRKDSVSKKIISLHQKVTRAQNEIRRDDKLRNQSSQQRKQKALKELTDIEIQLTENESLLDKLIKEKNSSDFAVVRNNIVNTNQRLGKVDIVDNQVKERVVLLSQKLTETVKTLDRVMAKREFESKFDKSLATYERIIRNFDAQANAEDTINNLESLRHSVQNIEEINESTKSRKKELLNNVDYQIDKAKDHVDNNTDKKIIEKIVEDNVILRKKVKNTDKEHTVIDQFITYWYNVKSNFDVNSYSNLSLLRIDSVLEDMQQSINDIRVAIANKCETNLPSHLIRKHSQSLPRLNTRKSYGSSRSLDQLENKIIKTKAKVYNMSTPELQNVEKQDQNYVNKRFSKIEEIKLQVHYIKEKINDTHNKNLLKDKLEQCLKNLEIYLNDANKTVQNNANLVSNEIFELLHKLVLADYSERIDLLSKRADNFNGSRYDKDYDEIKEALIETQLNVEAFNIPVRYEPLSQEKNELLYQVRNCIELLQEKASYYRRQEDENVKNIKGKLQELNGKVNRFSGSYKSVLYNSIERDLNKLLLKVSEQVDDKVWSDELIKDTEKLLKILEHRASRAQSFKVNQPDQIKSDKQMGMTKIKQDLSNIKREIDKTPDTNVDAFIGLQSRLDLVSLELGQIVVRSNENLAKEKEIFSNETQTLKHVVDAKVALGQQPVQWPERELQPNPTTYPKTDINREIEQFEKSFEGIKRQITAPNNEQDIHKFYKLAQDIKILMEKLYRYRFIRGTDLQIRQSNLLTEMQQYVEELEKAATDINYVLNIEKKLDRLENQFESDQQNDLKSMAKELQVIQKKLKEHQFITANDVLRNRKSSVQQKTEDLAQKLKDLESNETKQLIETTQKVDAVEDELSDITSQITAFVGLKSDNKYHDLNDTTTRAILALEKINTESKELQKRKLKLLKDLRMLEQILDERAHQTEEIVNLEMTLSEVSSKINYFSGREDEAASIKSEMETIKMHLQGLKVINDLIPRKNACVERFNVLFNKTMALSPVQQISPAKTSQINHSTGYSKVTVISHQNSSGSVSHVYQFANKSPTNENVLGNIETDIKEMETSVSTTDDVNQLQQFDEALTQFTIQIGKLNYTKESHQYPKLVDLYQRIETLTDVIEDKMQQHDRLISVSEEIDSISSQMNTPLTYEEINQLDERLIELQITLGKMNNAGMKAQIDGCMLRIILCLQRISEFKASVQNTPL